MESNSGSLCFFLNFFFKTSLNQEHVRPSSSSSHLRPVVLFKSYVLIYSYTYSFIYLNEKLYSKKISLRKDTHNKSQSVIRNMLQRLYEIINQELR